MSTLKNQIQAIEDLLTDASHWTQFVSARNLDGASVASDNITAVAWCLIGAMQKVAPNRVERAKLFEAFCRHTPSNHYGSLVNFNDASNHAEVIAVIRAAKEVA